MLGRAHRANPEAVLVVAGCYAQQDPEAVLALPCLLYTSIYGAHSVTR